MNNFVISGFADEISSEFDVQLKELKNMNIANIEVRGVDGKNISELTMDEVNVVKDKLDQHKIKVSAIGSPIGKIKITEDFEDHFQLFKHIVNIALALDTKYIRMFSFFVEEGQADVYRDEVMLRLNRFKTYIKDKEIILLHENEKDIYGDTAKRCLDLYETLGDKQFKLIFDPANFIQCHENTLEAFDLLKEHVVYLHIKDADANGNVVPAGYGIGEISQILQGLISRDFQGYLSLEPHLGHFEGFDTLETSTFDSKSDVGKFKLAVDSLRQILEVIHA